MNARLIRLIDDDPYVSFSFRVEIDKLTVAGFSEATGLGFETEVETFREGGENRFEHQLAGANKFPGRLILKRGLAAVDELWKWYRQISIGDVLRKTVTVVLLDYVGDEKRRWTFQEACPVKWTGPEFKAESAAIAFESVELVHRGVR